MSLDRAITLPHEFDKKEDNYPIGDPDTGIAEVLRSPTKSSMKPSQGPGEHTRLEAIEK